MQFTKEEQKQIDETLDTITADLEELWISGGKHDIKIPINMAGIEKETDSNFYKFGWSFNLTTKGFFLTSKFQKDIIHLASPSADEKMKVVYGMYITSVVFIKEYPNTRKKVVKEIEKIMSKQYEKDRVLDEIKEIKKTYQKQADVEITLPPSQNAFKLEVEEEGNKKIGTIDFGNAIVRIITDGDLLLVKRENPKTKRK